MNKIAEILLVGFGELLKTALVLYIFYYSMTLIANVVL